MHEKNVTLGLRVDKISKSVCGLDPEVPYTHVKNFIRKAQLNVKSEKVWTFARPEMLLLQTRGVMET
jgi:hypothetical protein